MLFPVIVLIVVILCLYKTHLDRNVYNYWKRRGIETPKYKYFFGHFIDAVFLRRSAPELCRDIYRQFKGCNYVAVYKFMTPALIVRSPELVRDIMVKDFKSFHDNDVHVNRDADLVFANNPFACKGADWKPSRNQMAPIYSTSKVRAMMPHMLENSKKLETFLSNKCNPEFVIDANELSGRIMCENFASCSVGCNGDCFADGESEFLKTVNSFNTPTLINGLKTIAIFLCPYMSALLNVCFFDIQITNFFKRISSESLDYRMKAGVKNNDLLDSLINIKNRINDEKEFNLDNITIHVGAMYFDGVDTSSAVFSFVLYELATNPQVRKKLREEIDCVYSKTNELTYEVLSDMPYLDCFFKESLRKNTPVPLLFKRCTQPFKLPPMFENNEGPEPIVEPGTVMIIPVDALHHDEKFYSEPEKCVPERFFAEKATNGRYLPFGDGPRICVGMKFAQLQLKIAIVTIVKNFDVCLHEDTEVPVKMDKISLLIAPEKPIMIKIMKRLKF